MDLPAVGEGNASVDNTKAKLAKLDEVLTNHGLTEEKMKSLESVAPSQNPADAMKVLAANVKDKPGCVADMTADIDAMNDGEEKKMGMELEGELRDLKVDGDSVTATIVHTVNGEEKPQPIQFKKIDGGWLIDIPPPSGG